MSDTALEQLNYAFDLDGGGYSWDRVQDGDPFDGSAEYAIDDPPTEYVWMAQDHDDVAVCVLDTDTFGMYEHDKIWPEAITTGLNGDRVRYVLLGRGEIIDHDHECNCHGAPHDPTGAAGDSHTWEATGDSSDDPYPGCERCEGTGYVDVERAFYALYRCDHMDAQSVNERRARAQRDRRVRNHGLRRRRGV